MAGQKKEILGLQMDKNLSSQYFIAGKNPNHTSFMSEFQYSWRVEIIRKKNSIPRDKCFFIIIQSISCRYIMMEHYIFFNNFWQIILQFWDSCNKNYMCAYKLICLHLYFHFISICQITIYVWPLKEPTVISIKLIYYRFVAYLS